MNTFHKVLFVLAILITNCISASAIEFTVNGVRYSVNNDNTTVTVAGYPSGSMPTGHLTIPESVTFGGISFSVTSIGDEAFQRCSGLTSVTIGNSVTEIGEYAFNYCSGLRSVTIGNSVTSIGKRAFWYCTGLTSVTIPNSVTSIGDEAFEHCTGLTSVTIPNSVTSIGADAFGGCSGLTSVTIPKSVTSIGADAFWGTAWYNNQPDGLVYAGPVAYKYKGTMPSGTSIVLKEGTKGIAGGAFYGCSCLTSVTIPSTVKYIGSQAFSSSNELTELVWNAKSCNIGYDSYPESSHPFYSCPIMKLIVGDEVQQIPSYLMYKQIFLQSVTIPKSVTSIGKYAFKGCTRLTSVVWNAKNCSDFSYNSSPFNGLTNIKTFEFGSEVEKIPAYLCYGLTGLTSVTIGNSVTSIGSEAFSGCSALTSVTIGNSVTSIGGSAFYDCSGLTSVVWNAKNCSDFVSYSYPFEGLTSIKTFKVGNEVERIPAYLCSGLTGLTSVTIPNSVTEIGQGAFYDCSGLTSVTIGNSVTSIGDGAFEYCSGLTSVTIPNSVTSIDFRAFHRCRGLKSIKVESGNSVYDSRENCNAIIETATNTLISGCKNTIIPNSVTSIGNSSFSGCSGLTSVTIPNSVTSIGDGAFEHCTGLTSVTIPNSVTSIGYWAFCYCSGLTSVIIPNSVTSIGDEAFRGCSGLTRIDAYPNPEKVSIGEDAFSGVPKDGTLHVLPKYLSAYRTASQWCEFTNIKGDLTEIGDINLDGKVDVSDITTLVNMIANGETANLELADINADGKVNVSDVTALVNIILN